MPEANDADGRTLREIWGRGPSSLGEVRTLPTLAKLGSGTLAVTRDEQMVLGIRGRTHIASEGGSDPRKLLHVVAEGAMPTDVDAHGIYDPLATSRRGLAEELKIGAKTTDAGRIAELIPVGAFFDQLRWQPCFATLAKIELDWSELQTAAAAARDSWEVEALVDLPFDISHAGVQSLLLDKHPEFRLASNHAAACVWFALLWKHGFPTMRDHLFL